MKEKIKKAFKWLVKQPRKAVQWFILLYDESKFKRLVKKADKMALPYNQKHLILDIGPIENKFRSLLKRKFPNSVFLEDRLPALKIVNNDSRKFFNKKIPFFHAPWGQLVKMSMHDTKGFKNKNLKK